MFIGQSPGVEEDQQGLPHVGASGQFLQSVYIDGINLRPRTTIYLANGVRCGPHPTTNIGPFNKCRPYLLHDIVQICKTHHPCPPRLVFISAVALRSFLRFTTDDANVNQKQSFGMQGRGIRILTDETAWEMYFFSTYHPMVPMIHNPPSIHVVKDHLAILDRHLNKKIVAPTTEPLIVEPRMPE